MFRREAKTSVASRVSFYCGVGVMAFFWLIVAVVGVSVAGALLAHRRRRRGAAKGNRMQFKELALVQDALLSGLIEELQKKGTIDSRAHLLTHNKWIRVENPRLGW